MRVKPVIQNQRKFSQIRRKAKHCLQLELCCSVRGKSFKSFCWWNLTIKIAYQKILVKLCFINMVRPSLDFISCVCFVISNSINYAGHKGFKSTQGSSLTQSVLEESILSQVSSQINHQSQVSRKRYVLMQRVYVVIK